MAKRGWNLNCLTPMEKRFLNVNKKCRGKESPLHPVFLLQLSIGHKERGTMEGGLRTVRDNSELIMGKPD